MPGLQTSSAQAPRLKTPSSTPFPRPTAVRARRPSPPRPRASLSLRECPEAQSERARQSGQAETQEQRQSVIAHQEQHTARRRPFRFGFGFPRRRQQHHPQGRTVARRSHQKQGQENTPPSRSRIPMLNHNQAALSRHELYQPRESRPHTPTTKRFNTARGLSPEELEILKKPSVRRLVNVTQLCKRLLYSLPCL